MNFSYSAVWDDTVRLLRSNASLIAAIAGVFVFLPNLLFDHFRPFTPSEAAKAVDQFNQYLDYIQANLLWLFIIGLLAMVGNLAILLLIFDRSRPTVAAAIGRGFALLPFYFAASCLAGIMLVAGFFLLILPAFYLYGRLAPLAAIMVAEDQRQPLQALRRSFDLTKGRGWSVLGLVLAVAIPGQIVIGIVRMVIGILLLLLFGRDLGAFLLLIVGTALGTALTALLIVLVAAIYRRLAEPESIRSRRN